MLEIRNISKVYTTGDFTQRALDDVSIQFRDNEFVSILGPSGSGKTTLLNIVGGLDRYDSGDLFINGVSTKGYKDRDWDSYRNHQIGFVFQSYNLIEHQSILSNVELALALSGVSSKERKRKALEALDKVGLKDHVNKRPNQLSGGQMQRVAIARALVNDPEILLADEPTGALDTATSVQILDLLKEIAQEKLVIMVTHNATLAEDYSTRIIKLQDGRVVSDTNPILRQPDETDKTSKQKKTKMSLRTALGLSLNNLLTKKGRTILTAFAGSIGIIGIALILSLSNGVQQYIQRVEEETLANYPLSIQETSMSVTDVLTTIQQPESIEDPQENTIYSLPSINEMLKLMSERKTTNNLEEFKTYLEDNPELIEPYVQSVQLQYPIGLNIYAQDDDDSYIQVSPNTLLEDMDLMSTTEGLSVGMMESEVFFEVVSTPDGQPDPSYTMVDGRWPENANEVMLVVDSDHRVSDYSLYSLGLLDRKELQENYDKIEENEELGDLEIQSFSFEEILNHEFKIILNTDYYEKSGDVWINQAEDQEYMEDIIDNARTLKVVGIFKSKVDEANEFISDAGYIGYTPELTSAIISEIKDSDIVKQQLADPEINVLNNLPFAQEEDAEFNIEDLSPEQQMQLATLSPEELADVMIAYRDYSQMTYESTLRELGVVDEDKPSAISLYPKDFDSKDQITLMIDDYNQLQRDEGLDGNVITYTDLIKTMMNSVTSIINMISYVLIAFVAISLIVSSIMIGIITYISVLERTKEIGILRSIGASKRDISRVFNAETLIIGLFSGMIGVGLTLVSLLPINSLISSLSGIDNLAALPVEAAGILVALSILLTVVSGLIPSNKASKKDPVEALRSE